MRVTVQIFKLPSEQEKVFSIEGCNFHTATTFVAALQTYLTCAKAVWPDELKDVEIKENK